MCHVCGIYRLYEQFEKTHLDSNPNGTADKMTMRKSIGVLMGLNFDPSSDRKRFCISDEKDLSDWMFENLIFLYCETEDPMAETKLITQYNPPLNIKTIPIR